MQYDIKKLVVDASVSFSIWQNFKHVTQARNEFRFILYLDNIAFSSFHLMICFNYWFRNNTLDVLLNFVHDELKAFILITRIDHKTRKFDLQSFFKRRFPFTEFLLPDYLYFKKTGSSSTYSPLQILNIL